MLLSENTDGQLSVGPDLNPIASSCSKTPESGETSTIGVVASPTVATVEAADPLSILITTLQSLILSSPEAETL